MTEFSISLTKFLPRLVQFSYLTFLVLLCSILVVISVGNPVCGHRCSPLQIIRMVRGTLDALCSSCGFRTSRISKLELLMFQLKQPVGGSERSPKGRPLLYVRYIRLCCPFTSETMIGRWSEDGQTIVLLRLLGCC